ncbi:hypothetical protein GF402_05855 [Candidatus Fermentibacteria bacterium]|nr:hypothetical protein [Candidatus Fermentibacteria bacterium]
MAAMLVLFTPVVLAEGNSETQTDWSGGDGVPGPLSSWGDEFDHCSDIVYYSTPGQIMLGLSAKSPVAHQVADGQSGIRSVRAADLSGDGVDDLVSCSYDGRIAWWENVGGSGTDWSMNTIDDLSGAVCVSTPDVDDDGDFDVVAVSYTQESVHLWKNLGGYWTEFILEEGFNGASSISYGDIDSDGDIDLVGSAQYDNDVVWWENLDGSGSNWSKRTVDSDFSGASFAVASDVNGDGKTDVIGVSYWGNQVCWWRNIDGSGNDWSENEIDSGFSGSNSVCALDIDGDGDQDVAGASYYGDRVVWWENRNGLGTVWSEHSVYSGFNGADFVDGADMDGDGDIDLMAAASSDDEVCWMENVDHTGTEWNIHSVTDDCNGATWVCAADFDDNHNLDLAAAAANADQLVWWEVVGYATDGQLYSSILDTQTYAKYETLEWTSDQPLMVECYFRVRSSNDPGNMGSWSEDITQSGEPLDIDVARYFQYQVLLESPDRTITPLLRDVTVHWTDVGVAEQGSTPVNGYSSLLGTAPNPSRGSFAVRFSVPSPSHVTLFVYDCSGRVVHTSRGFYHRGIHSVSVEGLDVGVYHCRMETDDLRACARAVVLGE